jgi:hypothetical protein
MGVKKGILTKTAMALEIKVNLSLLWNAASNAFPGALAAPIPQHRLVRSFYARAARIDADMLVEQLLASVPPEV